MQTHTQHTLFQALYGRHSLCKRRSTTASLYQTDASLPPFFSLVLYFTLSSQHCYSTTSPALSLWYGHWYSPCHVAPLLKFTNSRIYPTSPIYMLLLHLFPTLVWSSMSLFHYHPLASKDQDMYRPINLHLHRHIHVLDILKIILLIPSLLLWCFSYSF